MELRISFGKDNDELLFYAENDELDIKECITTLQGNTYKLPIPVTAEKLQELKDNHGITDDDIREIKDKAIALYNNLDKIMDYSDKAVTGYLNKGNVKVIDVDVTQALDEFYIETTDTKGKWWTNENLAYVEVVTYEVAEANDSDWGLTSDESYIVADSNSDYTKLNEAYCYRLM